MIRLPTLAASTLLAALALLPVTAPRADVSISFSSGSSHGYNHGNRHGNRFGNRQHGNQHRGYRSRGHSRHHSPRIVIAPFVFGAPGVYALGSGCRGITERAYDRFGRLVLLHRTLCYDRFGRPYVLGGPDGYGY